LQSHRLKIRHEGEINDFHEKRKRNQ